MCEGVGVHVYVRMCVFVFEDARTRVNLRVHVCEDMLWYENVYSHVCLYMRVNLRVRMCLLVRVDSLFRETLVLSTRHCPAPITDLFKTCIYLLTWTHMHAYMHED